VVLRLALRQRVVLLRAAVKVAVWDAAA
jgi:hypothetical protein